MCGWGGREGQRGKEAGMEEEEGMERGGGGVGGMADGVK